MKNVTIIAFFSFFCFIEMDAQHWDLGGNSFPTFPPLPSIIGTNTADNFNIHTNGLYRAQYTLDGNYEFGDNTNVFIGPPLNPMYSCIFGTGTNTINNSTTSNVFGDNQNTIGNSNTCNVFGNNLNSIYNSYTSNIFGQGGNSINNSYSSGIYGENANIVEGSNSSYIFGKISNQISQSNSSIIFGEDNNLIENSLSSSIVGFKDNVISYSNASMILGSNNDSIINSNASLLVGRNSNLINTSHSSIVTGERNKMANSKSAGIIGDTILINFSDYVTSFGKDNIIDNCNFTSAIGEDLSIEHSHGSLIVGGHSSVTSTGSSKLSNQYVFSMGRRNRVNNAVQSFVLGSYSSIDNYNTKSDNIIIGSKDSLNNSNSTIIIGAQSSSTNGKYNFLFGKDLEITNQEMSFAFGDSIENGASNTMKFGFQDTCDMTISQRGVSIKVEPRNTSYVPSHNLEVESSNRPEIQFKNLPFNDTSVHLVVVDSNTHELYRMRLNLNSGGNNNSWLLGGNTLSQPSYIGTNGLDDFRIYTNGSHRASYTSDTNYFFGLGSTFTNSNYSSLHGINLNITNSNNSYIIGENSHINTGNVTSNNLILGVGCAVNGLNGSNNSLIGQVNRINNSSASHINGAENLINNSNNSFTIGDVSITNGGFRNFNFGVGNQIIEGSSNFNIGFNNQIGNSSFQNGVASNFTIGNGLIIEPSIAFPNIQNSIIIGADLVNEVPNSLVMGFNHNRTLSLTDRGIAIQMDQGSRNYIPSHNLEVQADDLLNANHSNIQFNDLPIKNDSVDLVVIDTNTFELFRTRMINSGSNLISKCSTVNKVPKLIGIDTFGCSDITEINGYVGIGTNNPQANLDIINTRCDNKSALRIERVPIGCMPGSSHGNYIECTYMGASRFIVDEAGRVGIGASNPICPLDIVSGVSTFKVSRGCGSATPNISVVNTGSGARASALVSGTGGAGLFFDNAGSLIFATEPKSNFTNNTLGCANNTLMTLTNGGSLGIGTTSPSQKLHVTGNILVNSTLIASDKRFKKDIEPIKNAKEIISNLKGVNYYFETKRFVERNFSESKQYGFIAQEIEEVVPEAVDTDNKGFKSVNYIAIIPILTEAIKEQQVIIEESNSKIESLQSEVSSLKDRLERIEKMIGGTTGSQIESKNQLFDPVPNPNNGVSTISYQLAKDYSDAFISITGLDGKQLKSYKLDSKKGKGSIQLQLEDLATGTYMYTLVAGETVIDSKRLQILK